ncbi:hypothetical protein [Pseudomonas protegens]|uniref:hypothetical protein n=1 Tax=Pseudomonas protegens TaxID=380021 RepID=UPI0021AEC9A3|nr:hypothetical protein [Pseudomonas protegens]
MSTFIGTSVAGAYCISQNLKTLERESEVNKAWAMGIGLFIAMSLLVFFCRTASLRWFSGCHRSTK